MKECDESRYERAPRFYPPLIGCVAKDLSLCRMLSSLWSDTFSSFRCSLEGSLFLLPSDRAMGDALYRDAAELLEELRVLGELTVALGGCRFSEGGSKSGRCRSARELILGAIRDKRRRIDLYETVMSRTGDRVVRSVLSGLISSAKVS